ncbi:chromosomal replication initiator protein DnaA [bacterium]|nr:chromosomal replication initiator protein DnaA [bacterium]
MTNSRPLILNSPQNGSVQAADEAWHHICEKIGDDLPTKAFKTWFQPIKPLSFEEFTLTVEVPSRFYYEWIEGHYAANIENALEDTLGKSGKLVYSVSQKDGDELPEPPSAKPTTYAPLPEVVASPTYKSVDLNPRYCFSNFVEGPGNSFARAACTAVSQKPGKTSYNPLLLYGGVGLGKTHLLQAIGNESLRIYPDLRIKYISSERFTQDFVEAISKNRALQFSAEYRQVDILLLDDIQFLIDRERTMMEFFHTFNALHQAGKQIVLTSDKPPRELGGLDERLVSRIGWGLVCDIGPPDYDTRLAIIQRLAEEEYSELGTDVCHYLAQHITKNVRELQGALIRLFAQANLNGVDITLELAKRALQDLCETRDRRVSVDNIKKCTADHFKVSHDLLSAKVRTQPIARARMIAMALSVRMTGHSLKQIGRQFGNRDHTTVLHAKQTILKWENEDSVFANELDRLSRRIQEDSL